MSNTYLGEFLAQLQHEGYSIFLITGDVSESSIDQEPYCYVVCSAPPL